jgi:hypothetical protein
MEDTIKYLQEVFSMKDDKAGKCTKYKIMANNILEKSEYNSLDLGILLKALND